MTMASKLKKGSKTRKAYVPIDADGNMTKRTIASTSEETDYAWTEFDRLKSVDSSANGHMQDARYNVDGLRHRKTDKNGNSSEEYGVGITTAASAPVSGSSAPSISYVAGHLLLGAEVNGSFVFHLPDALGTVRDVVDDTGAVIKSFEFDEYGNLLSATGTGDTSPKTWIGGLSVNDDRADSGMFNMGHRNYAAGVLGRFISRDPIGHAGNLNLYAYPTNPVRYTDASGLLSVSSQSGKAEVKAFMGLLEAISGIPVKRVGNKVVVDTQRIGTKNLGAFATPETIDLVADLLDPTKKDVQFHVQSSDLLCWGGSYSFVRGKSLKSNPINAHGIDPVDIAVSAETDVVHALGFFVHELAEGKYEFRETNLEYESAHYKAIADENTFLKFHGAGTRPVIPDGSSIVYSDGFQAHTKQIGEGISAPNGCTPRTNRRR